MISVIIPFYNHHKYISECLQSFFNQTYQDFEIIVVDDGSQPQLNLNNKDIKVIRLNENKGVAAAKNKGLKHARGDFIKFFGADDIAFPYMLEKGLNAILNNTENRKWSTAGCRYIDIHGKKFECDAMINDFDNIKDQNVLGIEDIGVFGCGFADGSCLYRKELFDRYGNYDEKLRHGEDKIFWAKLFRRTEYPIFIYDYLYQYRQGSSITRHPKDINSSKRLNQLLDLRRNER